MKWLRTLLIFDRGDIASSSDWHTVHESYVRSICQVDFPKGSGGLTLRRKTLRDDGQWNRNGVGYLRERFLGHMVDDEGWEAEGRVRLDHAKVAPELRLYPGMESYREPVKSKFGGFDFVFDAPEGLRVAIEWETGNISSSHRSMNKLSIALISGALDAAVLIVPSRDLYEQLTDRVGNIAELSGYLSMWKDLEARVRHGLLAITVVEHDELTDDPGHPYLRVGIDGRAAEGKAKRTEIPPAAIED